MSLPGLTNVGDGPAKKISHYFCNVVHPLVPPVMKSTRTGTPEGQCIDSLTAAKSRKNNLTRTGRTNLCSEGKLSVLRHLDDIGNPARLAQQMSSASFARNAQKTSRPSCARVAH